MHVRMTVTYCKGKMTPKEGHVDCAPEKGPEILDQCFKILCGKHKELDKMVPQQLKQRRFDIVIHGEYLQGFDYKDNGDNIVPLNITTKWVYDKPLFNVLQLGIPEDERPVIKT